MNKCGQPWQMQSGVEVLLKSSREILKAMLALQALLTRSQDRRPIEKEESKLLQVQEMCHLTVSVLLAKKPA